MPDHIIDAPYIQYYRRMSITILVLYRRWLIAQALQASVSDIPSSLFLRVLLFQRTPHIEFMASTLQQDVTGLLANDYATRMLVDLGIARSLDLLFFLVIILIAVGYDYGK